MSRRKQLSFSGLQEPTKSDFGGSHVSGHARSVRPLSFKRPIHIVLRSTLATGPRSFLHRSRTRKIQETIQRVGRQKGVRVYRYANSGNHLHLLVLARSPHAYKAFIRSISGLIARITLGAERGKAQGLKFWDALPFTRIVEWGSAFRVASAYLLQNELEALGFIPYRARTGDPPKARRSLPA